MMWNSKSLKQRAVCIIGKLVRTKPSPTDEQTSNQKSELKRCLTTLDLTSLGVGSCVGTGMYLVTGMVARNVAGPAVIISFIIAATASIFSGVCYAEFGVRVPHTSGSAYMYSYVTVGEFIAFVIGWNMVLEYLIGTSACASAISSCFDALTNGNLNSDVKETFGTIFGEPPDVIALGITLLMTVLLVAGVKKSLAFSNVLNSINMSVWVFIMVAGLFYANKSNWTDHGGFMPYGWSGVLTGAATCFYAFIGFDIIATTGEEANSPQRSIPLAIIISLVIILTAYVTSSMMVTLIIPYNRINSESALVEMFSQRGALEAKYIVSVGALAGLTVSMFGSMFPMPRVVYAMAKDGLIFRVFAKVWTVTGTPAIATVVFGIAAAIVALFVSLEVLVEMMSIGTLLAYTLVSTCVLILRYQPEKTSLIELLPQSIRSACPSACTTPTRDVPQVDSIKVRKQRFGSPDSDDMSESTAPSDQLDDNQDNEYLVPDKCDYNKIYGAINAGQKSKQIPTISKNIGKMQKYFPALYYSLFNTTSATEGTGMLVIKIVGVMYLIIIVMDLIVACAMSKLVDGDAVTIFFFVLCFLGMIVCLVLISIQPQNRKTLKFMAPGLPVIPTIAVTINIYLIMKLSILTLIRFTVWMIIGLFLYFCYGIRNSDLEIKNNKETSIELTIPERKRDTLNDNNGDIGVIKTDDKDLSSLNEDDKSTLCQKQNNHSHERDTYSNSSDTFNPRSKWQTFD
ncbi:SLC7A14 (predicted) [Pycnogonum litorale]